LKDEKLIKSITTWKLKHTDSILESFVKIDPYNFELYRFKVGEFFETQCINNPRPTSRNA